MINYKDYYDEELEDKTKDEVVEDQEAVEESIIEEVVEGDSSLIGKVNASEVYIREGPGKNFKPKTTVRKDAELMIFDSNSNTEWYKVMNAAGVEGYIMKDYVNV